MKSIKQLISITEGTNIESPVTTAYKMIFEGVPSSWETTPVPSSSPASNNMYSPVAGSTGMNISNQFNNHVANTPASTRDTNEETRKEWVELPKGKPPITVTQNPFIKKSIKTANSHIPGVTTMGISGTERRLFTNFAAPRNGVAVDMPKIN